MQRYWALFFLFLTVLLSSCSASSGVCKKAPSLSADCARRHQQYNLGQTLISDGVQVIRVGDEITLLLSPNDFFYYNSNHSKNNTAVLNDIIEFINHYPTLNVQVTGYADNIALARGQAESIIQYLIKHGVQTRLLSANAQNSPGENPRIEIFFRVPPPDNVFH